MRRLLVLVCSALCLAAAGVAGVGWMWSRPSASAAAQTAGPATRRVPVPWNGIDAYGTEEEWVVSDISAAVIGLADYARTGAAAARKVTVRSSAAGAAPAGSGAARDSGTFTVKAGKDVESRIDIHGYLWAPDNYVRLAQSALGPLATAADPEPEARSTTTVVRDLTDPSVERLIAVNRTISDKLSQRVTSAAAHEEAALLIGTFALRESAGLLADSRSELSRLTAHLAFARVLRHGAPSSLAGTIAEAILLTLVNRQADALVRVLAIEAAAGTPGAMNWARALRVRITGDWREPLPAGASTIERLSYGRALRAQLNSPRVQDYVDKQDVDARADWQRLSLMGSGFSVEVGHLFANDGLQREIDEMSRVWPAYHQQPAEYRDALLAGLNDLPSASPIVRRAGKPAIEVIDWGRWAAFLQRHLCGYLSAEFTHLGNLGLDDEKQTLLAKRTPEFGKLRLFPIVGRRLALTQTDYVGAVNGALELAAAHPELIPPAAWESFVKKPERLEPVAFPPLPSWFQPGVPTGTAMELHIRTMTPYTEMATAAQHARWVSLAPHDGWAVWMKLWHDTAGKPRIEDALRAYGPALDYQGGALTRIFDHVSGDPEAFVPIARRICDLNADNCAKLAWQLVNVDDSEGAARAFERYAAEARDTVGVSNHMYWLVDYYHETGRTKRAHEIARKAAATGSARGMETWAHLLERTGDSAGAEEIYRHIAQRYTTGQNLLGAFCIRLARRTGDKADLEQGTSLLAKTLPRGLEPWTAADTANPPTDGARVTFTYPRARRLGLRENDIVVAIDGLRVRDAWARPVITNFELDTGITLVVWRDGRYQELALEVPQRWFGATFETYKPPQQASAAPRQ